MQPEKAPGSPPSSIILLVITIFALVLFYIGWGLNGTKDLQSSIGLVMIILAFVFSIGIVAGRMWALVGYTLVVFSLATMTLYEYASQPKELIYTLVALVALLSPLIILWVRHRGLFR